MAPEETTTATLAAPARPLDPEWADWPDDRLLDLRLCDLRVTIEGSAG